ncbi:ArsR/SmtB family transcription factor [Demequina sp. SO4-18]|uniref:ArsR/SmtB family transcription factor n=1 Tax=Demequina sp. SO4-18 TaxID=3401026 RepID=UPI003B5B016E
MSLDAMGDQLERAADLHRTLKALADPVRRFLLDLLAEGEATAGDLAASAAVNFGISAKRGSQHLQVLAKAGLVHVSPDGPWRTYELRPGGTDLLVEWLARLERSARLN